MPAVEGNDDLPLLAKWALGAAASSLAEAATLPIDVTKVRLQLQNELGAGGGAYRGMLRTGLGIARDEGAAALYKGLPAALLRQSVYGGIGIGLYKPVRQLIAGDAADPAFAQRILAGMMTGGTGQLIVSPLDVVKVRLQADGRLVAAGGKARYSGTFDALRRIPQEEGVAALLRGLTPSVSRAMCINGVGIATYDQAKQTAMRLTHTDGSSVLSHVASSMISGVVTALVSSPFDVVKTRIMNQPQGSELYAGVLDCLRKTVRAEGPLALYKGFLPSWSRLGPWQLVFFLSYEQLSLRVTGSSF